MGKAKLIKITPVVSHLRVYEEGDSYEARSPYTCIMTVVYHSDDTVHLIGAHGELGRATIREIKAVLKAAGVKRMTYEHKGGDVEEDL